MPKRSRYNYVTFVDGKTRICASGITYTFDTILNWETWTSRTNMKPPNYMLNVFCSSGDHLIRCSNESEMLSIVDELNIQGI